MNTPTDTSEPYLQWLQYALGLDQIPQTFTISYAEDEQTVPENYANIICGMFLQLGARGSSTIVSSGSNGVGGHNINDAGLCASNNDWTKTGFLPTYPASCTQLSVVLSMRANLVWSHRRMGHLCRCNNWLSGESHILFRWGLFELFQHPRLSEDCRCVVPEEARQ